MPRKKREELGLPDLNSQPIRTNGSEYTEEEIEFIFAVEKWKKKNKIKFPKSTDFLDIAKSLGYKR